MICERTINIDMDHPYSGEVFRFHEGDVDGSTIRLGIFKDSTAFDLSGCTAKYDAVIGSYLAEANASGTITENYVTIPVTGAMTAYPGNLKIDVRIIKNEDILFFQTLRAYVQPRVIDDSIVTPEGEPIADFLTRMEEEVDDLYAALEITPQSYGAVGDGIHDDTAAFQSALNAAAQEKKSLYLNGAFKLTDTVTVPQNSVIFGDGKHSAIVTTTAKTAFLHNPEDIASGETPALKSCSFRNVQFISAYLPGNNDSSDLGGVLFGSQVRGLFMENCTARAYARVFDEGITNLSRIKNNHFSEIREYFTKSVIDSSISKNYINASRITFGKTVAFRSGLYNAVVDGNYIDFWTAVFVTKDGAVSTIANNNFDNCYTVFFQRASMLTITGNTFSNIHYVENNWKSGSTYYIPTEYRVNWAVFRFNSSSDPLTAALIPLEDGEAASKRYSSLNRLTFTANILAGVANGSPLVDYLINIQSTTTIQGPVFSVVIADNEINPDTACDFKCSYSSLAVNLKGMYIQPLERVVYDALPNASLTTNPVTTYHGHQVIYQNRLTTNINGTWYSSALTDDIPSVPTKVSELTNDSGYLTIGTLPIYNGGVQ